MTQKKYVLYSALPHGEKPPCAFFASEAGCRNGDACKFAHVIGAPRTARAGSVVSSESSEGEVSSPQNKRISREETKQESVIDSQEKETSSSQNPANSKKKTRRGKRKPEDSPFANPTKSKKAKVEDAKPATPSLAVKKEKPVESEASDKKISVNVSNFLGLNLPVASFSIPGSTPDDVIHAKMAESEPVDQKVDSKPLPLHSDAGRKWLDAVKKTRAHPRYDANYDFEKMKQVEQEKGIGGPGSWIRAKPYGDWCKNLPQAIAIDCEMCETTDPVSGEKNPKALCRISIVDGENGNVLLDSLVKPAWPVSDYRTWVNGISKENLENVEFTLRHAQAFLLALCSEETVMIGHAVNNDLAALCMEHHCNVDSAHLFSRKEGGTVSLKDLATSVLKKEMPKKHDSVNDARTALQCLEYYLKQGGNVQPIDIPASSRSSYEQYQQQLFVHRIPKFVTPDHLKEMFVAHTDIKPSEVEEYQAAGEFQKTHVHFRSGRHADLAFEALEGKAETDPSGRLQKKVYLKDGGYIRIRKMTYEKKQNPPKRAASLG